MKTLSHSENIDLNTAEAILLQNEKISISQQSLDIVKKSFDFLNVFSKNKVIYGINTGFGPMAQYKVEASKQENLQYNLIRSHAAGAGEKIPDIYVKSSMLVRLKTILQGKSAIHPSCVLLLQQIINENIIPFIPEHGGVGASGDLVQLSHLALVLIGEGEVIYEGKLFNTKELFEKKGLQPITIKLREGLSLINGTSVMTGIGLINVIKSKQLLDWSLASSALLNEIVGTFDDHFSYELNSVKQHAGQQYVAGILRAILSDSQLINRRADHFYNSNTETIIFKRKVQEYYSLRCLPQILGAVYETINYTEKVIIDEMNSVSDNPIIDTETENVYHGGNFHGDYVSLEMDKLKMVVTRISMLSERQLAFLLNPKLNEILPPFVNLGILGLNLGMQGTQFTATSTTAENQMLSNSMYVHSITTNNDNQDIVSMGTNAAMITKRVIDNAYQIQAIEIITILQAVDCLKIQHKLSTFTGKIYNDLREIVPVFVEDTPKYKEIKAIADYIFENKITLPKL